MSTYSASTTFTVFQPNSTTAGDPTAVPTAAATCLGAAPTAACDSSIGSIAMGLGVCSTSPLGDTALCACVNNSLPCPQFTAPACANNAGAYQTTEQADAEGACAKLPLCINLVATGGTDAVVDGVTQVCGVSNTAVNFIETHRVLSVLIVVLFVLAVAVLAAAIARRQGPRGRNGAGEKIRRATDGL